MLRFEDSKQAPAACLQRVLDWLGLERSPAQIAAAVEASRVEHLQRVERERAGQPDARIFNRAGRAYEWQQAWWPHWHVGLGPHWAPLLQRLDYPPLQAAGGQGLAFDLPTVLAWRGLAETARREWMERLAAAAPVSRPELATP